MNRILTSIFSILLVVTVQAQNDRDYIRKGNRLMKDTVPERLQEKSQKAQVLYQKAVEYDNTNAIAHYNLGNSLLMQNKSEEAMKEYGIEVTRVGFRQLGFPESVTTKVFDRMTAERRSKSEALLANGNSEALRIRSEAERKAAEIIAVAEAKAKEIRGGA